MKLKEVFGMFFLFLITFGVFTSADVISVNSGGGTGIVITPGAGIEGFFFAFNRGPANPAPFLVSLNGRNESDTDLNCSYTVTDPDSSTLNSTVKWYKNSTYQFSVNENNLPNDTHVNSLLNNGNLTLGDTWMCSVKVSDRYNSTQYIDSNNLTIIDITNPNITIISPESKFYSTIDIDFNISVIENENISQCQYSLDYDPNVTMTRVNDSYFWFAPTTIGPGSHDLNYSCNDTSGNWGYNSTNFTVSNSAAIAVLLSDSLANEVRWNVTYLPANKLDAIGNNLNSSTSYYINISATNTLVDIYVKASGDLQTAALDTLGLGNETYTHSSNDSTLTGLSKNTMTTNYSLIGSGLGDNSVVFLKFYLDAPNSQPAGIYTNNLNFKAVRNGQDPNL